MSTFAEAMKLLSRQNSISEVLFFEMIDEATITQK